MLVKKKESFVQKKNECDNTSLSEAGRRMKGGQNEGILYFGDLQVLAGAG